VSVIAAPTEVEPRPVLPARPPAPAPAAASPPRLRPDAWGTLLVALILCLITFVASGGLTLSSATKVEMALTLGGGVVIAATVLLLRDRAQWPAHGLWPAIGMLALTALTALSVIWSVTPDASWQEASLILAYSVTFIAAAVLARAVPMRAPTVLGGIVLSAVIVCGYALLTKVFPASLDASDVFARLQAPYQYWNAIGLTAAMGIIGCLWLGARRDGHAALNALAYPATGLCVVTMLLAYSRGALLALAIGLALWFAAVPLRLRAASLLIVGGGAGLVVVVWAFGNASLSNDYVSLPQRVSAGHQLGVLLAALVLVLLVAGLAIGYVTSRRAPSLRLRRRAGALLLGGLALVPVVLVIGLAASQRGLTGTISHDYQTLTNLNPAVSSGPGRLTAVGSVRALYWDEALKVWRAHPAVGVGAGGYATARLHFAHDTLDVRDAHGYIVQTLADLGVVGLLLSLALFVVWWAAAARSARPFGLRWVRDASASGPLPWRLRSLPTPYTPERVMLLSMLAIVVVFGVHSTVDWTWFVPGNACVALLCAGWLAGRGPAATTPALADISIVAPREPNGRRARVLGALGLPAALRWPRPADIGAPRALAAAAVLLFALVGAWTQWQPQRSVDADNAALVTLSVHQPAAALADAELAVHRDPLSAQALITLAQVQVSTHDIAGAQLTLDHAVNLQPANPQTWLALASFDETARADPRAALTDVKPAVYLDPTSAQADGEYVYALRQVQPHAAITGVTPAVTVNPSRVAGAGGGR